MQACPTKVIEHRDKSKSLLDSILLSDLLLAFEWKSFFLLWKTLNNFNFLFPIRHLNTNFFKLYYYFNWRSLLSFQVTVTLASSLKRNKEEKFVIWNPNLFLIRENTINGTPRSKTKIDLKIVLQFCWTKSPYKSHSSII